jgi:hypothetical protein
VTDRYAKGAGNNANSGLSWALAKANLFNLISGSAAGDCYLLGDDYYDMSSLSTFTFPGTADTPCFIQTTADHTTPASTATLASGVYAGFSNGSALVWNGSFHAYGLDIQNSANAANAIAQAGATGNIQRYERCRFRLTGGPAASAQRIQVGHLTNPTFVRWQACDVEFTHASQSIVVLTSRFEWCGGAFIGGNGANYATVPPTFFFTFGAANRSVSALIEGVDFSLAPPATSSWDFKVTMLGGGTVVFRNCKFNAGWVTPSYASTPSNSLVAGSRLEFWNCYKAGDTPTGYELRIEERAAILISDTTKVRTNTLGATSPVSWRIYTGWYNQSTNTDYAQEFKTPDIMRWVTASASPVTVTLEFCVITLPVGVTLNTNLFWIEAEYYSASGSLLGTFASSKPLSVHHSGGESNAVNHVASLSTWNEASYTPYQVSVSFTPAQAGYIVVRAVQRVSARILIDPNISVS